jgi:pimeloyl-ACP methyl ester carboxylesterase
VTDFLSRSDGARIAYAVHGEETGQPPLLLTHGFAIDQTLWDPNLADLAADRRVVTWDIRGHGRTDAPPDPALFTHETCLGDMLALLDAVGAERAVLAGMSLGGYLSMLLLARHPERVAGLVLVDTGPGYRDDAARSAWNAWAETTAQKMEQPGHALAARGILPQQDAEVMESLPRAAVPTLVVVGEQDKPFRRPAEVMAARIPRARLVVIEGAGHASNQDRPAEFAAAVRSLLEVL